jgi:hypothetical protein
MYDKGLHYLAYLILSFLLWSAINPNKKVNWRKATIWWVLLVVVLYGVFDELLQGFVAGRSCDATDFVANLAGSLTGLIMLSIFTFWPVCLIVTGITIFVLTNITRVDISSMLPVLDKVFHIIAYAFFTLLWVQYIHQKLEILKPPKPKWLLATLSMPIGLLLAVQLSSLILGRTFTMTEVIISVVGILVIAGTIFVSGLCKNHISKIKNLS